ncbi:MAG: arsenite methyltransferase [Bradymonadaceae bacterium]|nr:arsenite methyltransferase [Lujinxingiaceae bacterium]
MNPNKTNDQVRSDVRDGYAAIVDNASKTSCCGPSCCAPVVSSRAQTLAEQIGYSIEELAQIPKEANLGLGCGNPTAIAGLQPGEVVLDLGSGAGMDAFLAAQKVGQGGRVIGVDMTPQMLARARETASAKGLSGYVEFREGLIEALPVVSESVDVVISNCVINLSPDKPQAFAEAYRVLKPGGRLAVSDICLSRALPEAVMENAALYVSCIGGAALADDYFATMSEAGFVDIRWTRSSAAAVVGAACCDTTLQGAFDGLDSATREHVLGSIWSYRIEARKP